MDDAFCYWRWVEYSISASIMSMALGITLGIREQIALASLFMLTWCCQWFGFLVEYISVCQRRTWTWSTTSTPWDRSR